MQPVAYGFGVTLNGPHAEALAQVRAALAAEGFGVITEIDVSATMKEKLGRQMPPYVILGACNPKLASRVLDAEPELGLFLPCNVIVYETAEGTRVSAMDPQALAAVAGGDVIDAVAAEVRERLLRVVQGLEDRHRRKENAT